MNLFLKDIFRRRESLDREIFPDEIFLDARNLPQFDTHQLEGRMEHPISRRTIWVFGFFGLIVALVFVCRLWFLEIVQGEVYAVLSEENRLRHTIIFPDRGIITDRRGEVLASNEAASGEAFSARRYTTRRGLGHILGFVSYPAKDSAGFYYNTSLEGREGVERFFNDTLGGVAGLQVVETDVRGVVQSANILNPPRSGEPLKLSVDAALTEKLYSIIADLAGEVGFEGGAGVFLDVNTGEIVAMTSFPEYIPDVLSQGIDAAAIESYRLDSRKPFLNRAVRGLYTPGSIVKPFLALAALKENIIKPEEEIVSTGSISIPNPFDKTKQSVFKDWKAHGPVDMRRALAVSSNVYFYEIGGGFRNRRGLGISAIGKYMKMFGFGEPVPADFPVDEKGVVPDPLWKSEKFGGDPWRLGDTYNTSIGQYGFQVTPLQVARAIAAIANGGRLPILALVLDEDAAPVFDTLPFGGGELQVVKEGLREGVLSGTVQALNIPDVSVAAKTGTAQVGTKKLFVNSWVAGFFPFESPRFAFAVVMERGPQANLIGAPFVVKRFLEWMATEAPEYLAPK